MVRTKLRLLFASQLCGKIELVELILYMLKMIDKNITACLRNFLYVQLYLPLKVFVCVHQPTRFSTCIDPWMCPVILTTHHTSIEVRKFLLYRSFTKWNTCFEPVSVCNLYNKFNWCRSTFEVSLIWSEILLRCIFSLFHTREKSSILNLWQWRQSCLLTEVPSWHDNSN